MLEKIINKIQKTNSSFLFVGPEGVRKKHTALLVCKRILNDTDRIDREIHPNVIRIRPENKEIKIEEIRNLIESLNFTPTEEGPRFIIIEDAHTLNNSSSNALLKTLEEPPVRTIFILISKSLDSMLPTIISRCEIIRFKPLNKEELASAVNIDINHPFIPFAMGSITNLEFLIANNIEINQIIDFIDKNDKSYIEIKEITEKITTLSSNKTKAKEIEDIEKIINLIINKLLFKAHSYIEKGINTTNIINTINNIKNISKSLYKNTNPSIVIENMLLETIEEKCKN